MITLSIRVCKKVGRANYGSDGADCGLANIELDESLLARPDQLAATIRKWYAVAQVAVEEQLARTDGQSQPARPANREPVAPQAPATARPGRSAPPTEDYEEGGEQADNEEPEEDDGPDPTTGSQLLAWARKQPGDMMGWIIGFGKKLKFRGRVVEWKPNQVTMAFDAARQSQQKQARR